MIDLISLVSTIVGGALIFIGGLYDLIAAIGVNRFPDFYTRLHAVTIGAIGGAVYPIIGAAIMVLGNTAFPLSVRTSYVLPMILIATLIIITAPTGSHAVARAAYRSGLQPLTEEE